MRFLKFRYSIAFVLLILVIYPGKHAGAEGLHLFAGAGMRQPIEQLVKSFKEKEGIAVYVDYGGSGHLMARILASGQGDLFMPGGFFYIQELDKEGIIHSFKPVVAHTPVVGVNREKAQLIKSFEDLAKPGLRLAMGDPKAMAFGRIASDILNRSGLKEAVLKNVVVRGVTVKQLALYVAEGDVDASIIGRADAFQFQEEIIIVPIPDSLFQAETIAVAVLKHSDQLPEALRFQTFMSSPEALKVFKLFGFLPLKGSEGQGEQ